MTDDQGIHNLYCESDIIRLVSLIFSVLVELTEKIADFLDVSNASYQLHGVQTDSYWLVKFPALYGTLRFINMFTRAKHLSCPEFNPHPQTLFKICFNILYSVITVHLFTVTIYIHRLDATLF
jgi:hypothetical protein